MSGGGGGVPTGPPTDPGAQCDDIRFKTRLASPNSAVIEQLGPGDELDIVLHESAIAAMHETGIAGSIVEHVPELIRCLQQGFRYKALIIAIRESLVDVEVVPA